MCGILGISIKKINKELFDNIFHIYSSQKNRGTNGCGVALCRNGKISRIRGRDSDELFNKESFIKFWKSLRTKDLVLIHHRMPSAGGSGNILESNHPLTDEKRSMMLIHNGVINNYVTLYNLLTEKGHNFESEITTITKKGKVVSYDITDSEVMVHLLEDKKVSRAIKQIRKVSGGIAVAFIKKGKNRIYLYRNNTYPIEVYSDKFGNIYFSSEFHNSDNRFIHKVTLKEGILYAIDSKLREIIKVKDEVIEVAKKINGKQRSIFDFDGVMSYDEYKKWY